MNLETLVTPKSAPDARDRTKVLCGCGLSRTFPFCDSSQMIARTKERGKLMRCGPVSVATGTDPQAAAI